MESTKKSSWLFYAAFIFCVIVGAFTYLSETTQAQSIHGWQAEYYDNVGFVGDPVSVGFDQIIDFDWGLSAPNANVGEDEFSVVWRKTVWLVDAQVYQLTLSADSNLALFINDYRTYTAKENVGLSLPINLSAGRNDLRVEYQETGGTAHAKVNFEPMYLLPDASSTAPVAHENLVDQGWQAHYFASPDLTGDPVLTAMHPAINFEWGESAPIASMPKDGFSMRWHKTIVLEEASLYRFVARADDDIHLLVDGEEIVNAWQRQADIWLSAGSHEIVVEYFEYDERAFVFVDYQEIVDSETAVFGILKLPQITEDVELTYSRENESTVVSARIFFEDGEGDVITADWGHLQHIKGNPESFVFRDSDIDIEKTSQIKGALYEETFVCDPNDFETNFKMLVALVDEAGNRSHSSLFEIDCSMEAS